MHSGGRVFRWSASMREGANANQVRGDPPGRLREPLHVRFSRTMPRLAPVERPLSAVFG
jgi:hypothetical protein